MLITPPPLLWKLKSTQFENNSTTSQSLHSYNSFISSFQSKSQKVETQKYAALICYSSFTVTVRKERDYRYRSHTGFLFNFFLHLFQIFYTLIACSGGGVQWEGTLISREKMRQLCKIISLHNSVISI